MRVGFAGTPDFAARVLDAVLAAGIVVPLVLTQPDRPQGRGLDVKASPVKRVALHHTIPLLQPVTLRADESCSVLFTIPLDVLLVAAYGLLLPVDVLCWPRLGCINVHASLLPRWRGAAPIQRALLAGDAETGISLMQMDAGLDTGPILDRVRIAIEARETAGTLHDKLADAGARGVVSLLDRISRGEMLDATPQPRDGVTYAAKIDRADSIIDWTASALSIDRQVRALNPIPGAITTHGAKVVKVWSAQPLPAVPPGTSPGTVVAANARALTVACGEGALDLMELQPAGGKPMSAAAFIAGRRIAAGDRFGATH